MTILPSSPVRDVASWLIWFIVFLTLLLPQTGISKQAGVEIWQSSLDPGPWLGPGLRQSWQVIKWWFRRKLNQWQQWLVLAGRLWACRNLAQVLQVLTRRQIVRYLGALPVLVVLLERLQVRQIINRHAPTRSPIDHGAVVLVLVLNRLMAPRPLYKIVDWLATTLIAEHLGMPVLATWVVRTNN